MGKDDDFELIKKPRREDIERIPTQEYLNYYKPYVDFRDPEPIPRRDKWGNPLREIPSWKDDLSPKVVKDYSGLLNSRTITNDLSALDLTSLETLARKIKHSDITRILLKEDESYKRGEALGQEGQAPNLKDYFWFFANDDFGFAIKWSSAFDGVLSTFGQGYQAGLQHFMQEKGIEGNADQLSNLEAMIAFVKGANLQAPGIEHLTFVLGKSYDLHAWPSVSLTKEFKSGYSLGFRVGIAREHGVTLEFAPTGNYDYELFMQGLRGDARSKGFDVSFGPYLKDKDVARYTQMIYESGLNVWLQAQGIKSVTARQISDSTSLTAFKAALNGEVLPDYEPKPVTDDDIKIIYSKHVTEFYLNKNFSKDPMRSKYTVPLDLARMAQLEQAIGKRGYDLGKKARAEVHKE